MPAEPCTICEASDGLAARAVCSPSSYAAEYIWNTPCAPLPLPTLAPQPLSKTHVAARAEAFTPTDCALAAAWAPHGVAIIVLSASLLPELPPPDPPPMPVPPVPPAPVPGPPSNGPNGLGVPTFTVTTGAPGSDT